MAFEKVFDERIAELGTGVQRDAYTEYCRQGSFARAAKALGKSKPAVFHSLKALEKKATAKGLIQACSAEGVAGPGRRVGKVTTHTKDGVVVQEWVRTDKQQQDLEAQMELFASALRDQVPVRDYEIVGPEFFDADLLANIPIGDPHLGMYAWAEETGEDFNCDICEQQTIRAVDRVVDAMPSCGVCRIEELGDLFHSDTEDAMTRRSGHHLDVDGRWGRVVKIALRMLTHCVDRCLEKHERVELVCVKGNHDDQTAFCLAMMMDEHYRNEPRVWVDTKYTTFHFKEFGQVLLGANHGIIKPAALHTVMTCDQAEAWGRTKFRYWHVGHVHHHRVIEIGGCTVEAFRSLKAKDSYEASNGYRAGRDLVGIVYHKECGEVERHTCNPQRLLLSC